VLDAQELDDAELAKVVGGGEGFCVIVGLYDDVDADCGHPEGYACAWLGVSFG